jgi:hypothetical protein
MELYFAYLDDLEEKKKAAAADQAWQCEVTILPQSDDAVPAESARKPSSRFVCDEPE